MPLSLQFDAYLKFLEKFETGYVNVPKIRILPLGMIGTGKSSFINSVYSLLKKRICNIATVRNSDKTVTGKVSQTRKLQ